MTPPPPVRPSVRVVKSFLFKGQTHRWSNRYFFDGGTPSSSANWDALFDAIVNLEKTCHRISTTIVECVGYAAGSDLAVHSKTYATGGTLSSSGLTCPGECAVLLRFSTAARSTKNHPIYAFSYFHGALRNPADGSHDLVDTSQRTAYGVFAAGWISGITAGGITATRATPSGHACTGQVVEEYITHRDFPASTSV